MLFKHFRCELPLILVQKSRVCESFLIFCFFVYSFGWLVGWCCCYLGALCCLKQIICKFFKRETFGRLNSFLFQFSYIFLDFYNIIIMMISPIFFTLYMLGWNHNLINTYLYMNVNVNVNENQLPNESTILHPLIAHSINCSQKFVKIYGQNLYKNRFFLK